MGPSPRFIAEGLRLALLSFCQIHAACLHHIADVAQIHGSAHVFRRPGTAHIAQLQFAAHAARL